MIVDQVGPAAFVQYGLVLLWVTLVAVFLQTVFNTEIMRWTIATGEPVVTGFMRTGPWAPFWAWFYALLYFLQVGWPGWAGAAARAPSSSSSSATLRVWSKGTRST